MNRPEVRPSLVHFNEWVGKRSGRTPVFHQQWQASNVECKAFIKVKEVKILSNNICYLDFLDLSQIVVWYSFCLQCNGTDVLRSISWLFFWWILSLNSKKCQKKALALLKNWILCQIHVLPQFSRSPIDNTTDFIDNSDYT